MMSPLAAAPTTRRAEALWLAYSPLWMAAVAVVQFSRSFTRWGDWQHLLFGVGLALPLWIAPLCAGWIGDRRPLRERYLTKITVFVAIFSFAQNYFGTDLFFTVLGMRYHFHTGLLVNGTPLFLYFLTVAYFSTYFAVMQGALRTFDRALPAARPLLRLPFMAALCFGVAFGETFFMANEHLREVFSYADKGRALGVGSLCYGTLFFIALPLFYRVGGPGEPEAAGPSLGRVTWEALGANLLVLSCYEVYKVLLHMPYGRP